MSSRLRDMRKVLSIITPMDRHPTLRQSRCGRATRCAGVACFLIAVFVSGAAMAAQFTVVNSNDSGAGSLRQALHDANLAPGLDTITFAIPGPGVHTIAPQPALPNVVSPTVIDGTTQPGYAGHPLIEL